LYVITFYSFKGGVGRTMALVNVAAELVRRGRRVLVVDFDLEAPGLETYKHLRPPEPHPGIVEYVTDYRRTYEVPNLLDYIYAAESIGKKGGRLWVMPAGRRDRDYRNALVALNWKRLYKEEDGFLLFEDMKKGWDEELKPDYVLIDSRTGDTDVLGICTRQLPDSAVLMFAPNEQNLAGLESVCRDIRREETVGLKKKIHLHFVAANVPNLDDENRILRRQLNAFCERLEIKWIDGVIRRYESLNLLDQSVFTLDRPHTRLARAYRRLLRMLLKDNLADRDGVLSFLGHPTRALTLDGGMNAGYLHMAETNHLYRIARHFLNDIEILNEVGWSLMQRGDYWSARRVFDRVLELDPTHTDANYHQMYEERKVYDVRSHAAAEDWPEGGFPTNKIQRGFRRRPHAEEMTDQ
jgi:MinD-like ATPase involved in chromosome partitioning or flagellar assembly